MDFRTHTTEVSGELREEQLNGRPHLVAPVVLIKEGVLNNALVVNDEIARSTPGWNGVPYVVHHPQDDDGQYISANQPQILNESGLGDIYNVEFNEGLVGETWLDVQRALDIGGEAEEVAELMAAHYLAQEGEIDANDDLPMLEVSTGYFYDPVDESGEYEGESYNERQTEIMPDHLAALPGGKGACSVEDGCGAPRVNEFMANRANEGGFIRNAAKRVGLLPDDADADGGDGGSSANPGGMAANGSDDNNNNDTPMGHQFTKLAEHSELSEKQLRELHDNDEDAFHALESALESNADGDGGNDDTPDDGGDGGTDDDDDDTDDDSAQNSAVLEEIQSLRDEVSSLKEDKEQSKRESAENTLEAKGYDPEQYEDMDANALETFANDAAPKAGANFGGQPGAGANMLGRGSGDVGANGEDEDEDYPDVGVLTSADAEGDD